VHSDTAYPTAFGRAEVKLALRWTGPGEPAMPPIVTVNKNENGSK